MQSIRSYHMILKGRFLKIRYYKCIHNIHCCVLNISYDACRKEKMECLGLLLITVILQLLCQIL